jgi:hypothetical protein
VPESGFASTERRNIAARWAFSAERELNMRASTAYFAGAGTIIVAIVAGLGGGLLMADIMGAKSPKPGAEMTRLERRMSPEPIKAAEAPPEPVPYLAAAPAANVAAPPAQAQPQVEAAHSAPNAAQPADTSAPVPPASPAPQVAAAPVAQPAAPEKTAAPVAAFARARDADIKRAEDRRRAERRQQWAERRRQRQPELKAVEEKVREDTEPRQEPAVEPVKIEMPLIRLFGPD